MRSHRSPLIVRAGWVAGLALVAALAFAEPSPTPTAKPKPKAAASASAAPSPGAKAGAKSGKASPKPPASAKSGSKASASPTTAASPGPAGDAIKPLTIPVPAGQTVKGIKIPYFDLAGKLRMQFFADEALRIDDQRVKMSRLRVELMGEEGTDENLVIDLPASELDLTTQVISSSDPVKITRSDFELEGASMEFDTRTRKGVMRGKVRMQIFDRKKL
jgi:hypothetical protein